MAPALVEPKAPPFCLHVGTAVCADQAVPLYCSWHDLVLPGVYPPAAIAAFCVPNPNKVPLAVIKLPPALHAVKGLLH